MSDPQVIQCPTCGKRLLIRQTASCACGAVVRRTVLESAARMMQKHRPSLERLAGADPQEQP